MAMATYEDFLKLDVKVGRVIEAESFPETRKPAYKLTFDFGPLERSSAQITDLYRPEDLVGKLVVTVANFPSKRIAGFSSEVLGAIFEGGKVIP